MATTKRSSWYKKWHDSDHHFLVHWGIFLIIIAAIWAGLYTRIGDWALSLTDPGVTVKLSKPTTELSLDPQTINVKVGDTIATKIILDTGGGKIDGVDIYSLHYDPSLIQILDDDTKKSGVQIMPGEILAINAANIVDPKTGTVKISQLADHGTSYHGSGVLATIHFKALAVGTAFLRFDYSPGNTVDSNAAYKGKDRLSKVVDAIYTIQPK
jgi:hypothetical protein